MTLLQARTTKVALCVVVLFAASGSATVIPVTNPSFETLPSGGLPLVCGTGCSYSQDGGIPGWTNNIGFVGQFQPGTQPPFDNHSSFNSLPDGITVAYSNGETISQVVGTVQDGEIYTLMVDLGQRNDRAFTASADLLVGGTMFMATGSTPSLGSWSTYTATFTGTAANVGDQITIQLNSTGEQGNFDNVRLTAVSSVPEPSSMLLLGSGVLVLVQGLRRKLL